MALKTYLISIILIITGILRAQIPSTQMNRKIDITTKEYVQMWLNVISVELSTGTLFYQDMGEIGCRVNLRINSDNKIEFELDDDYDTTLTESQNEQIIKNKIEFVSVALTDLFHNHFPMIKYIWNDDVEGYWYEKEGLIRIAKWKAGNIFWEIIPKRKNGKIFWENVNKQK